MIRLFIILILFNIINADYIVKTVKKIDILKNNIITARVDGEKAILNGYFKVEKAENLGIHGYSVYIYWTDYKEKNKKIPINLNSDLFLPTNIIPVRFTILAKGDLNIQQLSISDNQDNKKEKRNIPGNTNTGGTSVSLGSAGQNTTPKPTLPVTLKEIELIKTIDGCIHIYDQQKEEISLNQIVYYETAKGEKVIKEDCTFFKKVPAEKLECEPLNDFVNQVTFSRFNPVYRDPETDNVYTTVGCIPKKQFYHQIDFSVCPADNINGTYIKNGRIYYLNEKGEKNYISQCIKDPLNEVEDLLVKFESCPVQHNIEQNKSLHLGRYYWVKPDSTVEYLGNCVETKGSWMKHQFIPINKYKHYNNYSIRYVKRVLDIPSENRQVVIKDEEEKSELKYLHKKYAVVKYNFVPPKIGGVIKYLLLWRYS